MGSYLDSPMYQRMMAQTLAGSQHGPQYQGEAIANMLATALQAYGAKKAGQQDQAKEDAIGKTYSDAFAPVVDPKLLAQQIDTQTPGTLENQAGSMTQPTSAQSLAKLLSNPDVANQVGPSMASALVQSQAQANAPITPYQQAELARQTRLDSPEYQGQIKALPGPAPQPTAGMTPEAEAQQGRIQAGARTAALQDAITLKQTPSPPSATADDAGWVTLNDPKTNTQYDHNPRTGQNRTLDGKPYTPSGAGKIASNQARSPAAMYLQKYQAEHPDATSADLADVAATFGAQQKGVRDFATGPEGNIITRLNTAVSHLDTLQRIGMALDNGDAQAYNALRNAFRTQFGSELPTNFNAAMPIVAGEVSKAIVGTQGGTREDRAELERTLTDAASKRQLSGATGTQKALLQGQLSSRRKQYETATGRKDFDKFLSGETQKELGIDAGNGAPANDPLGLFK